MSAKAGDRAIATGDFVCERCGEEVRVGQGQVIPRCPNCDCDRYDERRNEPGDPPSNPSWFEPETRRTG
jgi:predicted  nucleic acid-binding Zn-ribbon protein